MAWPPDAKRRFVEPTKKVSKLIGAECFTFGTCSDVMEEGTNKNSKLVLMIWSGAACIWSPKDRWSAVHNWWSTVYHEKLSWSARFEIDQKCLNSNNVHVSIMWVLFGVFWVPTCPLAMDAPNKYQAVNVVVTIPMKDHTRKLCMVGSTTTSKDIAPNTAVHVRFGRCGFR